MVNYFKDLGEALWEHKYTLATGMLLGFLLAEAIL
jgi:hypothetical protein